MNIRQKVENLGYELPQAAAAVASYVPYVISGNNIYVAGQIPILAGTIQYNGRLGEDVTLEDGQAAARLCGLNILAQVDYAVEGDWSRVDRCIKLGGFVASAPDFTSHSLVINGASDLLVDILEEAGKHARFAVGVSSLPRGVPVEIDAVFALKPAAE